MEDPQPPKEGSHQPRTTNSIPPGTTSPVITTRCGGRSARVAAECPSPGDLRSPTPTGCRRPATTRLPTGGHVAVPIGGGDDPDSGKRLSGSRCWTPIQLGPVRTRRGAPEVRTVDEEPMIREVVGRLPNDLGRPMPRSSTFGSRPVSGRSGCRHLLRGEVEVALPAPTVDVRGVHRGLQDAGRVAAGGEPGV